MSLRLSLEYYITVRLLTEHHLEFLNLKGGCTGSSESTLVKCHIAGNYISWLILLSCTYESALEINRNYLGQFRGIPCNKISDVRRGSFFLSIFTGLLIHEHYTRECEFGNFDKIKNKNNTKNKTTQKNTKSFG